jgi:uncharacterized protein
MRRDVASRKTFILPKAPRLINLALLKQWRTRNCHFCKFHEKATIAVFPVQRPLRAKSMKLHTTNTQQYQTVTAYDDSGVEINAVRYAHSLIVLPEAKPVAWPVHSFESLTREHFELIDAQQPEVVILGTGKKQRFVHPKLIAPLTARHVGVESMDSQAACRTYNILMAEGRRVALALIIESTPT